MLLTPYGLEAPVVRSLSALPLLAFRGWATLYYPFALPSSVFAAWAAPQAVYLKQSLGP